MPSVLNHQHGSNRRSLQYVKEMKVTDDFVSGQCLANNVKTLAIR